MDIPIAKQDTLFVASLEKGMKVLEAFKAGRTEMGLQDLSAACGLDKSATQRFASTLWRLGYLAKDPKTRRYRLSIKCLGMANAYLWTEEIVRAAMPKMIDLRENIGETINLSVLDGTTIVYAARLPNSRTSYAASIIGRQIPALNTSSGRAMISRMDPGERRRCVEEWPMTRFTPNTLMDRILIGNLVERATETGYSISQDELILSEIGISAPIRSGGGARAAFHCSVSALKWTEKMVEERILPKIMDAANSL